MSTKTALEKCIERASWTSVLDPVGRVKAQATAELAALRGSIQHLETEIATLKAADPTTTIPASFVGVTELVALRKNTERLTLEAHTRLKLLTEVLLHIPDDYRCELCTTELRKAGFEQQSVECLIDAARRYIAAIDAARKEAPDD